MRKVAALMIFGRLRRGSAEKMQETTVQAKKSQSGKSSGVRLRPVRRVANQRSSQAITAIEIPIHDPAIECGAASA